MNRNYDVINFFAGIPKLQACLLKQPLKTLKIFTNLEIMYQNAICANIC